MPWSKVPGSERTDCGDDQVAVVKDADGSLAGCHDTEAAASDQIAALEASDAVEVSLADTDRLHIFRAGTHHGANDSVIDYTEEDVEAIANLYDPDLHEAPLVIGHPADNQPAFGWVDELTADGADLRATPHQVEQNFEDAVRSGRFKKISASFYPPDHPNHPVPDASEPYLRHVGFLGAKAPAVKGLDTPQLADDEDLDTITFDLADDMDDDSDARTVLQRLAEMLGVPMTDGSGPDDLEEEESEGNADQNVSAQVESPEDTDDASEEDASEDDQPSHVEELTERLDDLEERIEEKQSEVTSLEDELEAEREARKDAEQKAQRVDNLSEAEEQLRQREIEDAVQEAAENGRIHSKHVPLWQEVLELAEETGASLEEATIDFAEAEVGGEEAKDLRQTLEYIMNHQGPVVVLGEVADGEGADPVDFSDADSLRHAAKQEQERVKEETGEEIRYAEAMDNVLQRRDS